MAMNFAKICGLLIIYELYKTYDYIVCEWVRKIPKTRLRVLRMVPKPFTMVLQLDTDIGKYLLNT